MADETKTSINLQVALAGEADANRRYTAYGIRALQEGHPEIAQLFFEAAGAEAVHAYSLLSALGAIGSTTDNLRAAALGETGEIERRYPHMIAEAEAEGNLQALGAFRMALEREKRHQTTFRRALAAFETGEKELHESIVPPVVGIAPSREIPTNGATTTSAGDTMMVNEPTPMQGGRRETKRILKGLAEERARISRLAGIREVIFGGQDGLISTTTLVAGIAATTTQNVVVLVAGAIAAVAGALSMGVGSYLASHAQRQLYEAELAGERQEIADKPGEEIAELLAALIGRGMPRRDAIEVARRIGAHPRLMIDLLGTFELGLIPEGLGSPVRDAVVTGMAFLGGSLLPLVPFVVFEVTLGLIVTMGLAVVALFALGVAKARFSGRPLLTSGVEVVGLGGSAGVLGYVLGRVVSSLFGISI